jgi:hypothetical protein
MGADESGAGELPQSADTVIDLAYRVEQAAELARAKAFRYRCWDCGQESSVQMTGAEERGLLSEGHQEACTSCGQAVGRGRVKCRRCQVPFVVALPHWHVCCDLAAGNCPRCGEAYHSACIC